MNEKILNYIKNESVLKDRKIDEKEKYMLVKTLILANPVIGKITNISGINMIANKLEYYSDNDLADYMKHRYYYLTLIIRELLASEIIGEACSELLSHEKHHNILNYEDDFRVVHKFINDYTINTIIETSWLENGEVRSMEFNLDEFLTSMATKSYRPYNVIEFIDKNLKPTISEEDMINRVLKHPIFIDHDIDKLLYII